MLPEPDEAGVHDYCRRIHEARAAWEAELSVHGAGTGLTITSPLSGTTYTVPARATAGRLFVALQPHHDDLMLSAGGCLLAWCRPLVVITLFNRSGYTDPDLAMARGLDEDQVTGMRARESREALRGLADRLIDLGERDARHPFTAVPGPRLDAIRRAVASRIDGLPDFDLIAPAGVSRHPDHLATHTIARDLGCRRYWDDTNFYTAYGASVADRELFERRVGGTLVPEVHDITGVVLDKMTRLMMYESQVRAVEDIYRVLRYNWSVASAAGRAAAGGYHGVYSERWFRLARPRRATPDRRPANGGTR